MFIRWQHRKRRTTFHLSREGDVHWAAILAESARVDGKPTQRHIAYLGGFTESQAKIPAQQCHIWDAISERLDSFGKRLNPAERKRIEAAIAEKVPRPSRTEYKRIAGFEHLSKHQKAALRSTPSRRRAKR
jgi:hypothetical protein